MSLASCSSVLFLVQKVTAISGNKVNVTDTVGFVQEDNERDTISLLISCFATLGLCVYSAVHLNIPRKGESNYRVLLRELQWCVLGLFAPELILYTAWRKLASARQLCVEIANVTMTETHLGRPKTPWTITHGFYASMGSFAIELDSTNRRHSTLFNDLTRLTLTAKGVALLTKCGHVVEISLDDIKDKNKADGLAKLLVCIQAGWMIVQVISRTAIGLPTTLLEVHVVAHVVCALVMYILWWHKPRQVTSPTILKGDWMPLIAYMHMASRMGGKQPQSKLAFFRSATPELAKLAYVENENVPTGTCGDRQSLNTTRLSTASRLRPRPDIRIANQEAEAASCNSPIEATSELQRLAEEAIRLYPVLQDHFHPVSESECAKPTYKVPEVTELVQPYAIDWPNDGLLRRTQSLVMGMVLWGASVWVTFCAAFWLVTNLLAHVFPLIDRIWNTYNQRTLSILRTVFITTLCVLCGVSYIVSRAYIVIEAFVSIREVPRGVYKTPTWSQVFPHL
ncbi:hypothetical protein COCCADRAFT_38653 [Bipolaris zeicola 26-R-13]|uniref:Uncharacterized protein n=1 Tax=Cochliobolus carbonum (strain 26-R-13) TaxID=930089 RepID=W6XZV5_COCC2|nr:uncharacterized protein COCCADRAFT_38653 [Bipolaris zeicola 26-R-13]EUC31238.1 hypothetical protein COCCADRAFT_38653 [Bipolaris zeicola 26-R-13]